MLNRSRRTGKLAAAAKKPVQKLGYQQLFMYLDTSFNSTLLLYRNRHNIQNGYGQYSRVIIASEHKTLNFLKEGLVGWCKYTRVHY